MKPEISESARKSGVASVAVSWGFNTAEILQAYQPDYLVHYPAELLKAIADWQSCQAMSAIN